MPSTFTQKVLRIVSKIPKGSVLTYGQVARRAGSPNASRAVGQIMAQNKNPKIPCHRLIGAGGKLTGYSGKEGIQGKLRRLRTERVAIKLRP